MRRELALKLVWPQQGSQAWGCRRNSFLSSCANTGSGKHCHPPILPLPPEITKRQQEPHISTGSSLTSGLSDSLPPAQETCNSTQWPKIMLIRKKKNLLILKIGNPRFLDKSIVIIKIEFVFEDSFVVDFTGKCISRQGLSTNQGSHNLLWSQICVWFEYKPSL